MPRQPNKALGLVALALCLGLALGFVSNSAARGDDAPKAEAASGHGPEPAAAHDSEGGHGSSGSPNILEPQVPLIIWTVVVFLGLLTVLGKFAWKPLLTALHNREEHIEHCLIQTERARNESEQLLAEHKRRLLATEEQIRAMIDEARKNAQAAADDIVKKAQDEADASKVRAERDITNARDQALSDVWTRTADLAVAVATKVLSKQMSDEDHKRLIDSAIAELPEAPAARPGGHAA